MRELNIAVVGLGWVAGAHIHTFKSVKGARVVAAVSRREQNAAEVERKFGQPLRIYHTLENALRDDDIDIIDICTPHPLHAEQAIAAAKAGKHLIIEKPLALSWADSLRIRDAVQKANVKAAVCFECRHSAHFTLAKSMVDQGMLGKVHYAEVDYYHGIGPWYGQYEWNVKKDFGGSSLLTAGCHALDSLLYLMRDEVEEVSSYSTKSASPSFKDYEYPTTSSSLLKFKSGAVGKVASVIDCLQPYYFHSHLVGSEGSLLDNKFFSKKLNGLSKAQWSTLNVPLVDSGDVSDHPYQPLFQSFVDSLHNRTPVASCSLESALETHRVLFAADKSAQENRPVKISEFAL